MKKVRSVRTPCGRQGRIAARMSGVVLCGVLGLSPQGVHASAGVTRLEDLRFPAGALRERLADRLWLHGMPADVLVFDAPQSPSALARTLSAQQPALADLHVLPGQLILSGHVGAERWVVQMEGAGGDRTVGSLSAINVRAAATVARPAWLPEGMRVKSDVTAMDAGVKVSDRIWQHAMPPKELADLLDAGLRRAGWSPEREADAALPGVRPGGAGQWWTRERERMKLWLVPVEGGSGVRAVGWAP